MSENKNNSYILKGKITKVFDTQTFDSGFQKREFVIETEEDYPQQIKLSLTKDKCSLIDNFSQSDLLFCHINLRGNEWKDRFFVDVICWRIEKAGAENAKNVSESKNEDQGEPILPF
jgi:hypothetical protein